MKIGVFGRSPWSGTCRLAGHCPIELPFPEATVEDVAARLRRGQAVWEQRPRVDFLLDLIATSLQFVPEAGSEEGGPRARRPPSTRSTTRCTGWPSRPARRTPRRCARWR